MSQQEEYHKKTNALPPRSEVHKVKKQKKQKTRKSRLRYPLIRLLAFLFVLLPLTFFFLYTYWIKDNPNFPITNKTKEIFEFIQLEGSNPSS